MLASFQLELITPVHAPLEDIVVSSKIPHGEGNYLTRELEQVSTHVYPRLAAPTLSEKYQMHLIIIADIEQINEA